MNKKTLKTMIKTNEKGSGVLSFTAKGVIRRIPIEKRGTSKRGVEWTLGGVCLEVSEDGCEGSAMLYLIAWGDELVEEINRLGVGKKVKANYHIETREMYDSFRTDVVLDDINIDFD